MSTSILAIGTTAATSSSVTVAVGAPVTVGLFVTGGGTIPYIEDPVLCDIEDPGATFTQTSIILDSRDPVVLLIAPGVYRFRRPVITGGSVGIFRS